MDKIVEIFKGIGVRPLVLWIVLSGLVVLLMRFGGRPLDDTETLGAAIVCGIATIIVELAIKKLRGSRKFGPWSLLLVLVGSASVGGLAGCDFTSIQRSGSGVGDVVGSTGRDSGSSSGIGVRILRHEARLLLDDQFEARQAVMYSYIIIPNPRSIKNRAQINAVTEGFLCLFDKQSIDSWLMPNLGILYYPFKGPRSLYLDIEHKSRESLKLMVENYNEDIGRDIAQYLEFDFDGVYLVSSQKPLLIEIKKYSSVSRIDRNSEHLHVINFQDRTRRQILHTMEAFRAAAFEGQTLVDDGPTSMLENIATFFRAFGEVGHVITGSDGNTLAASASPTPNLCS